MDAIVIPDDKQRQIDLKKKQVAALTKWAFIIVGCAVTAPLAWMSVVGLIGWLIVAGIVGLIFTFAPVVGGYMANKKAQALEALAIQRIKDVTAAAEANPIETMQNLFVEKERELGTAEANTTSFETEIGNYLNVVEDLEKDQPEDAPPYRDIYNKMCEGLAIMNQQLTEARTELSEFKAKIKRAKAIFKASEAANAILNLSAEVGNAQIYQKIKEEVAFDTVRSSLNRTFASLNQTINRRKDLTTLAAAKQTRALPPAVEAEVIEVPQVISSKRFAPVIRK